MTTRHALLDTDAEFARMVDELTRRGFLTGAAGSAALLGLAACSSSGSPSGGSSAAVAAARIATLHGDIVLPAAPRRIVTTDFPEACALLDLGITPVGRTSYLPKFPAYSAATAGVPAVDDNAGGLVIEKIAALTPDLIIGDDWADPAKSHVPYDKLSKIAPTTLFAWEQAAGNWPTLAAQTAAAVGRTADMAKLQQRYEAQVATIRAANAALFGRTRWDLIDCGEKAWDLYGPSSSHGKVLTQAGVQLAAGRTQTSGYQEYSFERFDLLAHSDVLVLPSASLTFARKQPLFQRLPAVKAGRVYASELFFPASYGIALALLADLSSICAKLAGAAS